MNKIQRLFAFFLSNALSLSFANEALIQNYIEKIDDNNIQIATEKSDIELLESKMKKLAASDDGTSISFPLPTEYGTTNFMTKDELGEVMKFRPGKNRLLHCWVSCL